MSELLLVVRVQVHESDIPLVHAPGDDVPVVALGELKELAKRKLRRTDNAPRALTNPELLVLGSGEEPFLPDILNEFAAIRCEIIGVQDAKQARRIGLSAF